jgi:hypothetical protein
MADRERAIACLDQQRPVVVRTLRVPAAQIPGSETQASQTSPTA